MKHLQTFSLLAAILLTTGTAAHAEDAESLSKDLDKLEQKLASGKLRMFGFDHASIRRYLYDEVPQGIDAAALTKLKGRLHAVDVKLAAMAGSRAVKALGDGTRVKKADKEAIEIMGYAVAGCSSTGDRTDLAKTLADFEKSIAKAVKLDPNILRYVGETTGGSFNDIPVTIALCDLQFADVKLDQEDRYEYASPDVKKSSGCGYADYPMAKPVKGGVWTNVGTPLGGTALECSKFPKKSKLPGDLAKAAKKEFSGLLPKDILTLEGNIEEINRVALRRDGSEIEGKMQAWKVATIRIYSADTSLESSFCGVSDPKVVCEASGSTTVVSYNMLKHFTTRADLHRKAGRVERCKDMSKEGASAYQKFQDFFTEATKDGKWAKGLSYKTNDGMLSEKDIVAKVKQMGEGADEHATVAWCSKR